MCSTSPSWRPPVLLVAILGLVALSHGCVPEITGGAFLCDPGDRHPCPQDFQCLRWEGTHRCFPAGAFTCGNGVMEPGEECDGADLGSQTCERLFYRPGTLFCKADCTAHCSGCGNGVLEERPGGGAEECDDGNRTSHDGCSGECFEERPTWSVEASPFRPGSEGAAMAYDADRQRLVLFGGANSQGQRDETWEHDGVQWLRTPTSTAPPARGLASLVHDPSRGYLVLFGGTAGDRFLGDTWRYDGEWQPVAGEGPAPRARAAAAYDENLQRLVLFGGEDDDGVFDDTWTFDGLAWSELAPEVAPAGRSGAALTHHRALGMTVLYGGGTPGQVLGDTWGFDGAEWRNLTGPGDPTGSRIFHQLAYDPAREVAVLVGGLSPIHGTDQTTYRGDVWELGTSGWALNTRPARLVPGTGFAMAHDARRGRTVVVGDAYLGATKGTPHWELDGQRWEPRLPRDTPGFRELGAAACDDRRGVLVLHGGYVQDLEHPVSVISSDLWEHDGVTWRLIADDPGPGPRMGHALAFDPRLGVTFLFGGWAAGAQGTDALWAWDGETWAVHHPGGEDAPPAYFYATLSHFDEEVNGTLESRLLLFGGKTTQGPSGESWIYDPQQRRWSRPPVDQSPPARYWHAAVSDMRRNRVVLFGGQDLENVLQDTWEWTGQQWLKRSSRDTPLGRVGHLLAYHAGRSTVLLFGGESPVGAMEDTWEYDGVEGQWTRVSTTAGPSARTLILGGYDRFNDQLWVQGGLGYDETHVQQRYQGLWSLRYRSGREDELCHNQKDDDGDGRIDCADDACAEHWACQAH